MSTARTLKAVPDGKKSPTRRKPKSVTVEKAAAGSYRELLVALRDSIAGQIDDGVPARDLAALSKRLMEISKEIESIDAAEDDDDVGEAAVTPDEPWTAD